MTNELKDSPGWTPERRRLQAERIRRQRPWLRSTGPRTAAGKAVSSRNATKHGLRSRACRAFCLLLRMQRDFVRHINAFGAAPKGAIPVWLVQKLTNSAVNPEKNEFDSILIRNRAIMMRKDLPACL